MPARRQRAVSASPSPTTQATRSPGCRRRAEGVDERVAELAALVDRARHLRSDVARDAARERRTGGRAASRPGLVTADVRVELAVGAFEVGVRDQRRPAVAGPGDVDRAQVAGADLPVQVRVQQVEARHRAEVAEQARLDVLRLQRLAQERVVEQVDLRDGEVVGRPPVGVDQAQLFVRQRRGLGCRLALRSSHLLDAPSSSSAVSQLARLGWLRRIVPAERATRSSWAIHGHTWCAEALMARVVKCFE